MRWFSNLATQFSTQMTKCCPESVIELFSTD